LPRVNRNVCIIVENLPVPADRRVWQEARALTEEGYHVSIICPKGPGFERSKETIEGIEIYRHSTREASGLGGYFIEYSWALICEFVLAISIYSRTHFRILQACNPPDTIFLIALFFKLLGVRFIFDQHDLSPELVEAKFGRNHFLDGIVRLAEHLTFMVADVAIATNDSCREIALQRGGISPERSFVVRGCPDLKSFRLPAPFPDLKQGRAHLVLYLGFMSSQDGLDLLLESISHLVISNGRRDTLFVFVGAGPELGRLKATVAARGLDPWVKFAGALYGDDLRAYLATADVGVAPDPSNVLNDKLTMLKVLEYMACGLPIVMYDLVEGRVSAGCAALYARGNDPIDFADRIDQLLGSELLRRRLGEIGRKRITESLNWDVQKQYLLRAYRTAS
jgi:glycosyltransferase involved in cell wall biosynthesis